MSRPPPVLIVAAGFVVGATNHALDFARYGAWPYRFGGPLLDLFWNALLPLDLLVVALTLRWRWRTGMTVAVLVMALDVLANTYAWQVLGIDGFAGAVPIQAGFGLVVAGVAWRYRSAAGVAAG